MRSGSTRGEPAESPAESSVIGVDIGGTKIAAAAVAPSGAIVDMVQAPTPAAADVELAVLDLVASLGVVAGAVGVSVAGFVDRERSGVVFSPNIPGWTNRRLRADLASRWGCPVVLENDANAAAWGEATSGAGRGVDHLVCITVGTGLGGGVVSDGRLWRGAWGFAAEFGHLTFIEGGRPCSCGQRGCWERYVSGGALVMEAMQRGLDARSLGTDAGPDVSTPSGVQVMHAAQRGEPAAVAAFEAVGMHLGAGLARIAAVLDPALFVVGGGVLEGGELILAPARRSFGERLTARRHRPVAAVEAARLGSRAGIIGAASLARSAWSPERRA